MVTDADAARQRPAPFSDLDAYVGLPRVSGLRMSPDGRRLVAAVAVPDRKRARFVSALWEVDPTGQRPARRLTRSTEGESAAAFTAAGDLLFTSSRPDPEADSGEGTDHPKAALWFQPAAGGDARVVAAPPGGVHGVVVSDSGTVAFGTAMMPSATDADSDRLLRTRRKDAGVSAILHSEFPVRYWDHDLGPDRTRLLAADLPAPDSDARPDWRDLTGHVGRALRDDSTWDITPDGGTVVAVWTVGEPGGSQRDTVVAIDVASGTRTTLADDADHEYAGPRISPDGTQVAVSVHRRASPDHPGDLWLAVLPVAGGPVRALTREWDRWPGAVRWTPDGTALVTTADDNGRAPLWRVDVATGEPTRLTGDDGAYTDVNVSPDGRWVYALRSAVDSPPRPVRVALAGGSDATPLPGPAEVLGMDVTVPGRLEEVSTVAADGATVRAWLALPDGADAEHPVPLLLWIHGGPIGSTNAWSWRWNPWVAVAAGYAVLLPDPAVSTGYGMDFILRGWSAWGDTPYTDLMSITDAALERPDLDATRTAAMGGSFGGYMANWIAGHTDRFDAIVTHASVWTLERSVGAGDVAHDFRREMSRETAEANSPHHFADAITTPMLVIHGAKDYRCPLDEGMNLWWDLSEHWRGDDDCPHRFLYFPDEGHWILGPSHAKLWYATVLAFLRTHVLGEPWQAPDLLG